MRVIATVNTTRFSLDGVSYFKNYISDVKGNQITIFNCYDRKDVKLDWTDFADIELNGTVYASAILLQSALLPVIYTRASLGSGGGSSTPSLSEVLGVADREINPALDGDTLEFLQAHKFLVTCEQLGGNTTFIVPLNYSSPDLESPNEVELKILNNSAFTITLEADTDVVLIGSVLQIPQNAIACVKCLGDGFTYSVTYQTNAVGGGGASLIREEFTFGLSQTFTLANDYGQVYSVEVQGQGALSTSQYTLVSPNQVTINDTLNTGDYVVVIYSNAVTGVQPYYSQAETDALVNNVAILKSVGPTYTTNAILTVTQAEYDALTPDPTTLYVIL